MLAAVLALSSADSAMIGASASELRQSFGISNGELGVLASITTAVAALATVPAGSLVDRHKRVRILAFSIVLWGVAMAASAAAPSYLYLVGARVGLGVVSATGYPAVASLLGDYFGATERGRIYGLVLTGELVGAGAGFILAGELAPITWRLSFAVMAVPAAVLACLFARMPEPPRSTDAEEQTRMPLLKAAAYVLSVRTNLILIFSGACAYFFFAGVKTFGIEFATAQYHVSHGAATGLLLLIGVGAVAGVVTGGILGDRLESKKHPAGRIAVAAAAMEVTTLLFAPALAVTTALFAVPLLLVAAGAWGAVSAPVDAARLSVMPPRLWGRAEGIRSVIRQGAEAAAPALFGLVADSYGGKGAAGLQGAFFVMLIPLAVAGVIMAAAVRTYPRDAARHRGAEQKR